MTKTITALLIAVVIGAFPFTALNAKENNKYASLVIDADTGTVLSERYADSIRYPASLTKIMTLMMAFEALDRGEMKKSDRIRVSNHAASMVPSKFYLKPGSTIKVEDAIYGLVTKSANDVAVALAEHIGGTEYRFANLMTSRARSIGMKKTTFKNASGLPNSKQVTTARDMATLARYILMRYPHHYKYFSTRSFKYNGNSYRNHNRLMDSYKGMDGFKTGYINASGFNLVASARQDGRRLIGIVFGGKSSKTRNEHMAEILNTGFKKAKNIRVATLKTPPIPKSKPLMQVAGLHAGDISHDVALKPQYNNQSSSSISPNYTALTAALQEGQLGEMMGQGDIDDEASKRLETGMLAVSVHKGDYRDRNPQVIEPEAGQANLPTLTHPKHSIGKWAIQIGAFNSRLATDQALSAAQRKLQREDYTNLMPISVPLNTAGGMMFRARLGGMTEKQAFNACQYFTDCMPIAPQNVRISAQ